MPLAKVCEHCTFCIHCGGSYRISGGQFLSEVKLQEFVRSAGCQRSLVVLYLAGNLRLDFVWDFFPDTFFLGLNALLGRHLIPEEPASFPDLKVDAECTGYTVCSWTDKWTEFTEGESVDFPYVTRAPGELMGGYVVSPEANKGMSEKGRQCNAVHLIKFVNRQKKQTFELWPLVLWCVNQGFLFDACQIIGQWAGLKIMKREDVPPRALEKAKWQKLAQWMQLIETCHRTTVSDWATEPYQKSWRLLISFLKLDIKNPQHHGITGWTQKDPNGNPLSFDAILGGSLGEVPGATLHAMMTWGKNKGTRKYLVAANPHALLPLRDRKTWDVPVHTDHDFTCLAQALRFAEESTSRYRMTKITRDLDQRIRDTKVPLFVDFAKIPQYKIYPEEPPMTDLAAVTNERQEVFLAQTPAKPLADAQQGCTAKEGCLERSLDPRSLMPHACLRLSSGNGDFDNYIRRVYRENARNQILQIYEEKENL